MYPVADKQQRWELLKQYIRQGYMDSDTHLLGAYAEALNMSVPRRITLSFLYSTCYNVPTAVLLDHLLGPINVWTRGNINKVWRKYKDKLIFQTDRKWVKIANQFVDLCMDFQSNMTPYYTHIRPYVHSFDAMYARFSQLNNQGRVSTYIFIDGLINTGVMHQCIPERFDWNNGQTCTEGMMHAILRDDWVEYFDKGKRKLPQHMIDELDAHLDELLYQLVEEGLDDDYIWDYESNLCAYRKYFKGKMYYGYYMDRQLEELSKLRASLPEYEKLWGKLFQLRKDVYPANLLGEVSGWSGIRKHLMQDFLKTGVIEF